MLGIEKGDLEARVRKAIPKEDMAALQKQIFYSDKYTDDEFEYRQGRHAACLKCPLTGSQTAFTPFSALQHVMLPKEIAKLVPKTHLMTEHEWRSIGVQQSQGWVHFLRHDPEPHILLFRRRLPGAMITA
ncbi:hypothetical protein EGW08_010195 [Elysia chlorotica]|uniref:Cyclin-dependent kinases regulatory subunit n=1 Tax=Elysia chlorotica TaxID=188477 RepID=A0A3S0ZNK0_ELYCH|nr:hypothetical protein EGW08_010195 [Elysia chlorotica]